MKKTKLEEQRFNLTALGEATLMAHQKRCFFCKKPAPIFWGVFLSGERWTCVRHEHKEQVWKPISFQLASIRGLRGFV